MGTYLCIARPPRQRPRETAEMPVDFLNSEQRRNYARYNGEPTDADLARCFLLDAPDLARALKRKSHHCQLGFAVQLGTLRYLGAFLSQPQRVPVGVSGYVASQLGLESSCIRRYTRPATHCAHADEIRRDYGYRDFRAQPEHLRLVRWLYARAWIGAERPSTLFDRATEWLVERKVVLPGINILVRLIAAVRDRANARLWRTLGGLADDAMRSKLEMLLQTLQGRRRSNLERLRRSPATPNVDGLVAALQRLDEIQALGAGDIDLTHVPPSRLRVLSRYANAASTSRIARMPTRRRLATLVAFASQLTTTARDDVLDIFDVVVGELLQRVKATGASERYKTLPQLDAAALLLRDACLVLLQAEDDVADVRKAVFGSVSRARILTATDTVAKLARPQDDDYYDLLLTRYSHVRRFVPKMFETLSFRGKRVATPVIQAIEHLRDTEGQSQVPDVEGTPLELVNTKWRKLVVPTDDRVDRRAYTFCTLERLRAALRQRDVYVDNSQRWGDPRAQLLQGSAWEKARPHVCRSLKHNAHPGPELDALARELDAAYRKVAQRLPDNEAVKVETVKGRNRIRLSPLDRIGEPESLSSLRAQTAATLPLVELPELLLEIASWTGMAAEFTHLTEADSRVEDFTTSICAVLVAEACNIGIEPLARPDIPALTRDRLAWVAQNYVRAETLTKANARLVQYQSRIPVARRWGGGDVASADGMRFVVPVRTVNAGFNKRYFGQDRGVTYYNFMNDQRAGLPGIVIPGTIRDSLYILDGLLQHDPAQRPSELMVDTAGYSDVIFGLFWMLGYLFSPRLADTGGALFWRIDPKADYGDLNAIARGKVSISLIASHWDDLLRAAGSLKMGTVKATDLMRTLQSRGRTSAMARALAHLGRISKTLHLLRYIDDEGYRRRILVQLNHHESRHALARLVFHGKRGHLRQIYREGQEDQLGALGLVLNAIVLWNTRYIDAALEHLRQQGVTVRKEDVRRLSPFVSGHINLLGRYQFLLPSALGHDVLRQFRNLDPRADTVRLPQGQVSLPGLPPAGRPSKSANPSSIGGRDEP